MLQSNMSTKEAREVSLRLAEMLGVGVYDCTGAKNEWIKE